MVLMERRSESSGSRTSRKAKNLSTLASFCAGHYSTHKRLSAFIWEMQKPQEMAMQDEGLETKQYARALK